MFESESLISQKKPSSRSDSANSATSVKYIKAEINYVDDLYVKAADVGLRERSASPNKKKQVVFDNKNEVVDKVEHKNPVIDEFLKSGEWLEFLASKFVSNAFKHYEHYL